MLKLYIQKQRKRERELSEQSNCPSTIRFIPDSTFSQSSDMILMMKLRFIFDYRQFATTVLYFLLTRRSIVYSMAIHIC
jgi:hypothetical protein